MYIKYTVYLHSYTLQPTRYVIPYEQPIPLANFSSCRLSITSKLWNICPVSEAERSLQTIESSWPSSDRPWRGLGGEDILFLHSWMNTHFVVYASRISQVWLGLRSSQNTSNFHTNRALSFWNMYVCLEWFGRPVYHWRILGVGLLGLGIIVCKLFNNLPLAQVFWISFVLWKVYDRVPFSFIAYNLTYT